MEVLVYIMLIALTEYVNILLILCTLQMCDI